MALAAELKARTMAAAEGARERDAAREAKRKAKLDAEVTAIFPGWVHHLQVLARERADEHCRTVTARITTTGTPGVSEELAKRLRAWAGEEGLQIDACRATDGVVEITLKW